MVILHNYNTITLKWFYSLMIWSCMFQKSGGFDISDNNRFKVKEICYGKLRVATCGSQATIAIGDITYERNCTKLCPCTYNPKENCNEIRFKNSWKNYAYYNKLSGNFQGNVPSKRVKCGTEATTYTNNVKFNYICIQNNNISNFCDINITKSEQIIYLKYQQNDPILFSSSDCKCKAHSAFGSLQVYALDIRFQTFGDNSGNCNNQKSFLKMNDDMSNTTIQCMKQKILGNYENIYNSAGSYVDIQLHLEGDPQMVWIAVTATDGGLVNVTCNNDVSQTTTGIADTTVPEITTFKSTTWTTSKSTTIKLDTTTLSTSTYRVEGNNTISAIPDTTTNSKEHTFTKNLGKISTTTESVNVDTTALSSTLDSGKFYLNTSLTTQVDNLIDETSMMSTNRPTNKQTTSYTGSTFSKSKNQTDLAIIVLAVTGVLTFILIIIGVMIGRKRYQSKRLQKKREHYNNLKLDDVGHRENPTVNDNAYSTIPSRMNSQHEDKAANSVNNFERVDNLHRLSGESVNVYDTASHTSNHHALRDSTNGYDTTNHTLYPALHNNTDSNIYDKAISFPPSDVSIPKGQYDEVKLTNDASNSITSSSEFLHHEESIRPTSGSLNQDGFETNPYTDAAVVMGMASQREYKDRRSSTLLFEKNYDESMNDLVKQASDWADKEH